jgi:hypothetical protein
MDIMSTETMLQEANISKGNARILFHHLRQFFGGRSYFASEQKRCIFFGGNDYPSTVGKNVLEDKTYTILFKSPNQLLQDQLKNMVDPEKLKFLKQLDIVIGGNHGGGEFRMAMMLNFWLPEKEIVPYLTQIASVSFSKDDTEILKERYSLLTYWRRATAYCQGWLLHKNSRDGSIIFKSRHGIRFDFQLFC